VTGVQTCALPIYMGWLSEEALALNLQSLWLEKRAGAIFAAKTLAQVSDSHLQNELQFIHRDEAQAARVLRHCLDLLNSSALIAEISFETQTGHASALMKCDDIQQRLENFYQTRSEFFEFIRKLISQCQQKSVVNQLQKILLLSQ